MSRPAVSELAPVEPSANVEQVEEVSADVSPELIRRVVFDNQFHRNYLGCGTCTCFLARFMAEVCTWLKQ